jgi:hypothetical protein
VDRVIRPPDGSVYVGVKLVVPCGTLGRLRYHSTWITMLVPEVVTLVQ